MTDIKDMVMLCKNCVLTKDQHDPNGHCLFEPTYFEPVDITKVKGQAEIIKYKEIIRKAHESIRRQTEQLEQTSIALDRTSELLGRTCTHRYANGKYAGDNGFLYSHCEICGAPLD
jgi:hypothetical protein